MRRSISFLVTIMVIILAGCKYDGPFTSTTSYLMVIDKKYSDDYKEAWIMAFDPTNSDKDKAFKVIVDEPMVWNLIETNNEYFAVYSKKRDKSWVLEHISLPGDNKSLQ